MPVCNQCGIELNEKQKSGQRIPCPRCKSLNRLFKVEIHETVEAHSSIKMVHRDQSGKKLAQIKSGDDFHWSSESWRNLERVIDWAKKKYKEVIIDLNTGEILKYTNEDLRDHIGHGAAKKK